MFLSDLRTLENLLTAYSFNAEAFTEDDGWELYKDTDHYFYSKI